MLKNALALAAAGNAGVSDEYFNYNTLLLKSDGNQGDTKFTNVDSPTYLAFSDESDNDFSITVNGDAYGSIFNPFLLHDGEWSVDLSNKGYFTFTGVGDTSLTGDFTWECWVYLKSYVGSSYNELSIFNNRSGSSTGTQIDIGNSVSGSAGSFGIWHNGSSIANTGGTKVVELNEWTHLAIVRSGTDTNNVKLYANGVQVGQGTSTDTLFGSSGTFYIGNSIYDQPFNNIISNLRLTKGFARYTQTFVPSVLPFDADPPPGGLVSLVCLQSKDFTIRSAQNNITTLTPGNSPKVSAFSLYKPNLTPTRFRYNEIITGIQAATVRRFPWVYMFGWQGPIIDGYVLGDLNFTGPVDNPTSSSVTSADTLVYLKWLTNVSITAEQEARIENVFNPYILQEAANTDNIYSPYYDALLSTGSGVEYPVVNTSAVQTAISQASVGSNPGNALFGTGGPTINGYYLADITNNGLISSSDTLDYSRWVSGTLTNQTSKDWIELVLHPYILANSNTYADYITTGGIDPSTYAFGSGYFDGSGDYATIADTSTLEPGTDNFRIECWVYHTTAASGITIYTSHTGGGFSLYRNASGKLAFGQDAVAEQVASTPSIPINQWVHVMVIRNSTSLYLYINGEQVGSASSISTNYAGSGSINIGGSSSGYIHTGWISGLRIIIGDVTETQPLPVSGGNPEIEEMPTKTANTQLLTCKYQGTVRNIGFEDTSRLNYIITENGDPTIGTFSPFSAPDGQWAIHFDGNPSTFLNLNNQLAFGTNDFTFEVWVYLTNLSATNFIIDYRSSGNGDYFAVFIQSTGLTNLYVNGVTQILADDAIALNTWAHICIERSSGISTMYINGVPQSTTWNDSTNYLTQTVRPRIGEIGLAADFPFFGYMSNMRAVVGSTVYNGAFTPSTSSLTAVSNTELLTCQSNRFVDNSSNGFTVGKNGDVKIAPFSPFAPADSYLPSVNGGSVYLDGNGDWLNLTNEPANFGTENEWCVEFWFWLNEDGIGYQPLIHNQGTADQRGWIIYIETSGALSMAISNGSAWQTYAPAPNFTPKRNSWTHFAVARKDGTIACWVNGVRTDYDTGIGSASMHDVSNGFKVGYYQYFPGGARDLNGFISGLKITKGASPRNIEDTTIDISTPVTRDENTVLLMNFDNAGIIDYTGKTNLKSFYNTQIDTNTTKFNTGSLKFDGTDDYLITQTLPEYSFGSSDFTMEMWVNGDATQPNDPSLLGNWTGTWAANNWSLHYRHNAVTAGKINFWMYNFSSSVPMLVSTTTTTAGTWYHVALTRSGNTYRLFVDGNLEDEETSVSANTDAPGSSRFIIVGHLISGVANSTAFKGYLDDLRITKGVARYTETFTPPTKSFPVK